MNAADLAALSCPCPDSSADLVRLRARIKWAKKPKQDRSSYMREWRLKNPEQYKAGILRHYNTNKAHVISQQVLYMGGARYKARQAVLDKFGRKCKECGFSDERALQIDHVRGGAYLDKKNGTCASRLAFLRRVLIDSDDEFQLLCANCNWIKRDTNNELRRSKWRVKNELS